MEYTASHKNSFKRWVKDGILHYDTPQILALIQPPVSMSTYFFGIKKKQFWRTFDAEFNLEIKIPSIVLNKIFLIFQILCGIILSMMKSLKKKDFLVKIMQNLRTLPCQNTVVVGFFCQSNYALKEF